MEKIHISLNRDVISLKIKSLLKDSVLEEKPLIVDLFTNMIISSSKGPENLFLADINQLDDKYYPVGAVVLFPVDKINGFYSSKIKEELLSKPEEYGIVDDCMKGVVINVYPFSHFIHYSVAYKGLDSDLKRIDSTVELNKDHLKLYEYE